MGIVRDELGNIAPYVPGKSVTQVEQEAGITGAIKLSSNENPLGPSEAVIMELKSLLSSVSEYPDSNAVCLRGLLAGSMAVSFSSIIVGNGSNEIIEMVAKTFIRPNDVVVTSEPTFALYGRFTHLMGGVLESVSVDEYGYDMVGMAKVVNEKNAKVVFLANPNNPTGSIIELDEAEDFLNEISKDVIVVLDEAYIEYSKLYNEQDNGMAPLLSKFPNLIITRTFSKAYGLAGLRIGYGAGDPAIIEEMRKTTQPFNTGSVAQMAAAASLCDKEYLIKTIELNREGKRYLYDLFEQLNLWFQHTNANFIYFKVDTNGEKLFNDLVKEGVIIRHIEGSYMRVSIGTMQQNKRFAEALKKVTGSSL